MDHIMPQRRQERAAGDARTHREADVHSDHLLILGKMKPGNEVSFRCEVIRYKISKEFAVEGISRFNALRLPEKKQWLNE